MELLRATRNKTLRAVGVVLSTPVWLPVSITIFPFAITLIFLSYSISVSLYILFAQHDNPHRKTIYGIKLWSIPLNPKRVFTVTKRFLEQAQFYLMGPVVPIIFKYSMKKLMESRKLKDKVLIENIVYKKNKKNEDLLLDVHVAEKKFNVLESLDIQGSSFDLFFKVFMFHFFCEYLDSFVNIKPVIIFVYGGAWSTGNKRMYIPLAQTLRKKGYNVVVPNYTLFPKGKVEDMVHDIGDCIRWVYENIHKYEGDNKHIYLMGHSAGAHLCSLTVISNALTILQKMEDKADNSFESHIPPFETALPIIKGVVLLAGVFDIFKHLEHEALRGVEQISAMARAMGHSRRKFIYSSPQLVLPQYWNQDFLEVLPKNGDRADSQECLMHIDSYPKFEINKQKLAAVSELEIKKVIKKRKENLKIFLPKNWWLVHGKKDLTVPSVASLNFQATLIKLGLDNVHCTEYENVDHSRPVLELFLNESEYTVKFLNDFETFEKTCLNSGLENARTNSI
ncbi:hypothetical protein HDU92_002350 [Lobulomyces angularis]|nr:hypothetical protein HDU92_002350 [Lobulomyces angularis]